MKSRFSPVLLLALLAVTGMLAFSGFVAVYRHPAPAADADDEDTDAAPPGPNTMQGRRFDKTFGSLAALVPQGGSAPVIGTPAVLATSAGAGGAAAAAAASGAPEASPQAAPQVVASDNAVHGEQFRDLNWVKAQGGAFTLQVLGAHDESAVQQFIATQKDRTQFRYLQTTEAGQPWFVVIYGSFDTREQALAAADSLDGMRSRPFVRQFSAYAAGPVQTTPATPPATTP